MAVPTKYNLDSTGHLWGNSNVGAIDMSLGLNSTPSSINITLYDSDKAGEVFEKPSAGSNVSLKWNGLTFYGMLTDYQKSTGMGGMPYKVILNDARELMRHIVLVLEQNGNMFLKESIRTAVSEQLVKSYDPASEDYENELNSITEEFEELFPGISFDSYPLQLVYVGSKWWNKIKAKINNMTVYVNQTPLKFILSDEDWPSTLIYDYFEINSPSITLCDLFDDLSRRCGFDWYIDSSVDYVAGTAIPIRNIDRRQAPTQLTYTTSSGGIVVSPSPAVTGSIESFDEGETFINEGTGMVLFGGRQRNISKLILKGHLYDILTPGGVGGIYADSQVGVSALLALPGVKMVLEEENHKAVRALLAKFAVNLSYLTDTDADSYDNLKGFYLPSMAELQAALSSENTWVQYVISHSAAFQAAFPTAYFLYQKTGCATLTLAVALKRINRSIMPVTHSYKQHGIMNEDEKTLYPGYKYWILYFDKDLNQTTLYKAENNPGASSKIQYTDYTLPTDAVVIGSAAGYYPFKDLAKAEGRLLLTDAQVNLLEHRDMPFLSLICDEVRSLAEQYAETAFAIDPSESSVMGLGMETFFNGDFLGSTMYTKPASVTMRPAVQNKKLIRDSGWWRKNAVSSDYNMTGNTIEWLHFSEPTDSNTYSPDLNNRICQYFEDSSGMLPSLAVHKDVDLGAIEEVQSDVQYIHNINTERSVAYKAYEFDTIAVPNDVKAQFFDWDRNFMFIGEVGSNSVERNKRTVYWIGQKKSIGDIAESQYQIHSSMSESVIYSFDLNSESPEWVFVKDFEASVAKMTLSQINQLVKIQGKFSRPDKGALTEAQVTFYGDIYCRASVAAPFFILLVDKPVTPKSNVSNMKYADLFAIAAGLDAGDIANVLTKRGRIDDRVVMDAANIDKQRKLADTELMSVLAEMCKGVDKSLVPDYIYLPVELPTKYGPYVTTGLGTQPNGTVDYVADDSFVPDNYGSETALSIIMKEKADSVAFQDKIQYSYTIKVAGTPELSLGAKFANNALNSNITGMSVSVGEDGWRTTYTIESRKRQHSAFSDSTVEKANVISGLLTDAERQVAQMKTLKEFNRVKQRIQQNDAMNRVREEDKRQQFIDKLFKIKNGFTAKNIQIEA
jgi:hypothetical protein